jgi:hypothetical protein
MKVALVAREGGSEVVAGKEEEDEVEAEELRVLTGAALLVAETRKGKAE